MGHIALKRSTVLSGIDPLTLLGLAKPEALLPLGEDAGAVIADDVAHDDESGHDGTYSNVELGGDPLFGDLRGSSAAFNGLSSRIALANPAKLAPGDGSLTLFGWSHPDESVYGSTDDSLIWDLANGAGNEVIRVFYDSSGLRVFVRDAPGTNSAAILNAADISTTLPMYWRVAFIRPNGNASEGLISSIYVAQNGNDAASSTTDAAMIGGFDVFDNANVGATRFDTLHFTGKLQYVGVVLGEIDAAVERRIVRRSGIRV